VAAKLIEIVLNYVSTISVAVECCECQVLDNVKINVLLFLMVCIVRIHIEY
jgi:hypothetical protein